MSTGRSIVGSGLAGSERDDRRSSRGAAAGGSSTAEAASAAGSSAATRSSGSVVVHRGGSASSAARSSVSDARAISAATVSIAWRLSRSPARRSSAGAPGACVSERVVSASCRRACTASSRRASSERRATGHRVFARDTSSATVATRWSMRSIAAAELDGGARARLRRLARRGLDPLEPRRQLVDRCRARARGKAWSASRMSSTIDSMRVLDSVKWRWSVGELVLLVAEAGRSRLDGLGERVESLRKRCERVVRCAEAAIQVRLVDALEGVDALRQGCERVARRPDAMSELFFLRDPQRSSCPSAAERVDGERASRACHPSLRDGARGAPRRHSGRRRGAARGP